MFFRNLILVAAWLPVLQGAELNYNIPLWEAGKVPLAVGTGPLDAPFLTVFRPTGKPNGSAVVIAPGGSNIMLMYNLEGIDVAEKFNDWGTTAFVLTYRLNPRYDDKARAAEPSGVDKAELKKLAREGRWEELQRVGGDGALVFIDKSKNEVVRKVGWGGPRRALL